jgi:hypothetical protein
MRSDGIKLTAMLSINSALLKEQDVTNIKILPAPREFDLQQPKKVTTVSSSIASKPDGMKSSQNQSIVTGAV